MKCSRVMSYVKIPALTLLSDHVSLSVNIANGFRCLFVLGTGNTVIEAVKVLIEHGVKTSVIILLSLFSTPHGELNLQLQIVMRIVCISLASHPKANYSCQSILSLNLVLLVMTCVCHL